MNMETLATVTVAFLVGGTIKGVTGMGEGEVVGVVLLEASGDGSEVLQLVEEALDELVRLFPEITVPSPLAYYVVYRPERGGLPKLVAFRD